MRLASRQRLLRRGELYSASVLAQLKPEIISREMEDLDRQLYEIDHEDEIDELEKMAKANLEKIRQLKGRKKKEIADEAEEKTRRI